VVPNPQGPGYPAFQAELQLPAGTAEVYQVSLKKPLGLTLTGAQLCYALYYDVTFKAVCEVSFSAYSNSKHILWYIRQSPAGTSQNPAADHLVPYACWRSIACTPQAVMIPRALAPCFASSSH
jgi:hypothetical protein